MVVAARVVSAVVVPAAGVVAARLTTTVWRPARMPTHQWRTTHTCAGAPGDGTTHPHDAPCEQVVTLAVKMLKALRHQSRNLRVFQNALAVSSIQLGLDLCRLKQTEFHPKFD